MRAGGGEPLARWLAARPPTSTPEDLDRAVDEFAVVVGSAGDGRSVVRAYADETDGLTDDERTNLRRWESERRPGVYLLETCRREWMQVWDPLDGRMVSVQFATLMAPGRAAAMLHA